MIVATCASLVSRERLLRQAVGSLLPQVDAVCVYLNGHQQIPEFLRHPKVLYAVLSIEAGYRGGEGKFFFWDADAFKAPPAPWHPDTVGITFDDDIVFPPDYAARMVEALDRRPGSIACVHGSILTEPFVGWRQSRRCVHFAKPLAADTRIHVPGTGTMAFRARDFLISIQRDYPWSHCCDPVAGILAKRDGHEVWAVARKAGWLRALGQPKAGSTVSGQRVAANVDQAETDMIRAAGPWPALSWASSRPEADSAPARLARPTRTSRPTAPPVHFELIVPGWRCAPQVRPCWDSIASQRGGGYSWRAHFYDDNSADGETWRAIQSLPEDARLVRRLGRDNLGAAHARYQMILDVADPEAVCVLLDMDDQLEPGALARVAAEYRTKPDTWLTYGSWKPDRHEGMAQARAQRCYPPAVAAARSYRGREFLCGPLRTFRRHLADAVEPRHLQDAEGGWLPCATDVALMVALLEQCPPERVRWIRDVLYRYTWRRGTGTVRRYGAELKAAVCAHLAAMPPLPLKVLTPPPPP